MPEEKTAVAPVNGQAKPATYSEKLELQIGGIFTHEQIATCIKGGIVPREALNDRDAIGLFFHTCATAGANPIRKQAHMLPLPINIGTQANPVWSKRFVTAFAYTFIRGKCDETGEWGGQDEILFNGSLTLQECIDEGLKHPSSAKVTIYRIMNGVRFGTTFSVRWDEFSSSKPKWDPTSAKGQPFHMLGKCAVAHCTKAAFPAATEGMYIPEEFDHAQAPLTTTYQEIDLLPEALEALAGCETPDQVYSLETKYNDALNVRPEWTNAIQNKLDEIIENVEAEAGGIEVPEQEETTEQKPK